MNFLGMRSIRVEHDIWYTRVFFASISLMPLSFPADRYIVHLLASTMILAIAAIGEVVAFGKAGQLLLCQGAFWGVGAYISTLMVRNYGLHAWLGLLIAVIVAALCGLLVGLCTARTSGHYFGFITMALSLIFYELVLNWTSVSNGALGITSIPRLESIRFTGITLDFDNDSTFLLLVGVLGLFVTEAVACLLRSRVGKLMLAVREDELAATSLGIKITQIKIVAITSSACCAGLAGALFSSYERMISPDNFSVLQSILFLLIVLIGGREFLLGAAIGSAVLSILPEYLRIAGAGRWLLFAILLIVLIVFCPGGLLTFAHSSLARAPEPKATP